MILIQDVLQMDKCAGFPKSGLGNSKLNEEKKIYQTVSLNLVFSTNKLTR